jgi:hypothetical protein
MGGCETCKNGPLRLGDPQGFRCQKSRWSSLNPDEQCHAPFCVNWEHMPEDDPRWTQLDRWVAPSAWPRDPSKTRAPAGWTR